MNIKDLEYTQPLNLNPNLLISLGGLFLLCFNDEEKRVEAGYLNEEGHDPYFSLYKYNHIGGVPDILIENRDIKDKTIEILTSDNSIGRVYTGAESSKSFDKIINLEDLYEDDDLQIDADKSSNFSSRVYFNGCTIFSDGEKLSRVVAFEVGNESNVKFIKEVAGGINCITETDDFIEAISVDGQKLKDDSEQDVIFDKQSLYLVSISSTCPESATHSDFLSYHEVLTNQGDAVYNLKFESSSDNVGLNSNEYATSKVIVNNAIKAIEKTDNRDFIKLAAGFRETILNDINVAENSESIPTYLRSSIYFKINDFIEHVKEFDMSTDDLDELLKRLGLLSKLFCGRSTSVNSSYGTHPCLTCKYVKESARIPT